MWHRARASTGSDRSRLQPPSAVRVASRAWRCPSPSKPTRQRAWKPCRLPDMVMSCVRFSRSRTGRPVRVAPSAAMAAYAVGLHLLAAEGAAHAQALDGHLVAVQAEHVRDDLLGLGRVLGAALHEDLAALVDARQRAVGLEVEVLLAGELELAAEHVLAAVERRPRRLRARGAGCAPWKLLRRDRLADADQRGQRLVVDLDRRSAEPGCLEGLGRAPSRRRGRRT